MQIWTYSITTYDAAKEYFRSEEYECFVPSKAYGSLAKAKEALMSELNETCAEMEDEGSLGLTNPNPIKLNWTDGKSYEGKQIVKSTYDDYYTLAIIEMDLECDELSVGGV